MCIVHTHTDGGPLFAEPLEPKITSGTIHHLPSPPLLTGDYKGTLQKLLSGFFPLRGGGTPPVR